MSASSHGTRLLRTETFNVHHQQTSENSGEPVAQLKSRTVHRIPTEITPARHCDRRKMFTDEPCIVYHDVCQVIRIDRWRPIRVLLKMAGSGYRRFARSRLYEYILVVMRFYYCI